MTELTEQQAKGAAATVCVGAVLAAAGTFAAWITVSTGLGDVSKTGLDWSGDAKWLIVLAAIAALVAVSKVSGWKLPVLGGSVLIDGVIMLALTIYDAAQVSHRNDTVKSLGVSAHVGAGLWLSIAGSVAVLVGGFVLAGGWSTLGHQAKRAVTPWHVETEASESRPT